MGCDQFRPLSNTHCSRLFCWTVNRDVLHENSLSLMIHCPLRSWSSLKLRVTRGEALTLGSPRDGGQAAEHDAAGYIVVESGEPHSGVGLGEQGLQVAWSVALYNVDGFVVFLEDFDCGAGGFGEPLDEDTWPGWAAEDCMSLFQGSHEVLA